jgi:hypothetical protein
MGRARQAGRIKRQDWEKNMRKLHRQKTIGARRPVSYANVVSTLALVMAIGGGSALAATSATDSSKHKPKHHYVITSTSQIKPSVISKLHGANGKNGKNGTNGTNGTKGATGATGVTGSTGATGAAGAVAGYSASNVTAVTVPTGVNDGTFVTVASKVLPAGSYLVNAKTSVNATASAGQTGNVAPECDLFFGTSDVDSSQAQGPLGAGPLTLATFTATLADEAALTSASSVTVTLQCENQFGSQTALSMAAAFSKIEAVQTSANS